MPTLTTVNSATGQNIQTYAVVTVTDVTARIEACHTAFQEWRGLTHQDRAPFLAKIAQKLRDTADEFAALMTMTRETGKLPKDGYLEVEICDYTARHGPDALANEERTHGPDVRCGIVKCQPIGTIYSIQP